MKYIKVTRHRTSIHDELLETNTKNILKKK